MFKSHAYCSAEWCFKIRAPEVDNTNNDKEDEFCCKQNYNQLYNLLENTIFLFQTDKVLKKLLRIFDKQKTNQWTIKSYMLHKKQDNGT